MVWHRLTRNDYNQASTGKVKMGRLWTMSKDELGKHMEEIKKETQQMRTQKVTGGSGAKLNRM